MKFKDRYFMFYNSFDSYISGLGCKLLNQITYALSNDLWKIWKDRMYYAYFLVCQKQLIIAAITDNKSLLYLVPNSIVSIIFEYMTAIFNDSQPWIPPVHNICGINVCNIEQRLIDLPFVIEFDINRYKTDENKVIRNKSGKTDKSESDEGDEIERYFINIPVTDEYIQQCRNEERNNVYASLLGYWDILNKLQKAKYIQTDVDIYHRQMTQLFEFGRHPNIDNIKCKKLIDHNVEIVDENFQPSKYNCGYDGKKPIFLYPQHQRDYYVYCIDFEKDLFCLDDRRGNHKLAIKISKENIDNLDTETILKQGESWDVDGESW